MQIRDYQPSDAAAVTAMLMPVIRAGDTYTIDPDISDTDALAYWTGSERSVFVAEQNGVLLGTYYVVPNQRGGGRHVCNCGFVTATVAQGRGVARAMLEHALRSAKEMGFRAMQFNFVVASNARAVVTWEKAGFETVGRLPEAFLHPRQGYVDALVMYRRL